MESISNQLSSSFCSKASYSEFSYFKKHLVLSSGELCKVSAKDMNKIKEYLATHNMKVTTQRVVDACTHLQLDEDVKKYRVGIVKHLTNKQTALCYTPSQLQYYLDMFPIIFNTFLYLKKKKIIKNRVNFLHYPYVHFKLLQLSTFDKKEQMLETFKLLTPAKNRKQDIFWKLICEELGLTFIPTII
tara:strand:- start:149 stop:709 length:561 start_codon:yes stop_codon:yes gene_type:complete